MYGTIQRILFLLILSGSSALAGGLRPQLLLHGVTGELDDNIRALVDVSRYQCELPSWRFKRIQERTEKDTSKALRALGYYNAKIEVDRTNDDQCWSMEILVTPGKQVIVETVSIVVTGGLENTPGMQQLWKNLPVQSGSPLNHADYAKIKLDISSLASQYGFFSGEFTTRELRIDRQKNLAFIELKFSSGERAKIGAIQLEQSQFRDKFINKFLTIKEGDVFNSAKLTEQQSALNDSGYFSVVNIEVDRKASKDETIPIKITLQPRKRHAYRIGIGASTNEGPRVSFKFEDRWLNRRAHSYILNTSWSPIVAETGINYTIPLGDAGIHKLDLGIGFKDEDVDTSNSQTTKLAAKLTRVRSNGWKLITSIELLRENFSTADSSDIAQLVTPGIGYSKSVRDDPLYPRSGWRISTNLKLAAKDFFSDINLTQITANAKIIRPVNQHRILARAGAGFSEVDDFSKLPASLRFFAGGDSSVRGFDYKSLGPFDSNGEVTGGKNFLTGSLEYEHSIKQNWGLAIFVDAGNSFNNFNDYEIKKSVGIGGRFHSPIGPIRLDLAHDLDSSGSDIRLHLSMGPDL